PARTTPRARGRPARPQPRPSLAASARRGRPSYPGSSRRSPARSGRTSRGLPRREECPPPLSLLAPAANQLVLEPELVEAATHDEVDQVVDRPGSRVEPGREEQHDRARLLDAK